MSELHDLMIKKDFMKWWEHVETSKHALQCSAHIFLMNTYALQSLQKPAAFSFSRHCGTQHVRNKDLSSPSNLQVAAIGTSPGAVIGWANVWFCIQPLWTPFFLKSCLPWHRPFRLRRSRGRSCPGRDGTQSPPQVNPLQYQLLKIRHLGGSLNPNTSQALQHWLIKHRVAPNTAKGCKKSPVDASSSALCSPPSTLTAAPRRQRRCGTGTLKVNQQRKRQLPAPRCAQRRKWRPFSRSPTTRRSSAGFLHTLTWWHVLFWKDLVPWCSHSKYYRTWEDLQHCSIPHSADVLYLKSWFCCKKLS